VRKRQAEFFFGRLAARAALREHGAPVIDVPVGLACEPVWPEGVVGSISHTDALAAAVVGARVRHLGLGIDIERIASPESEQALRAVAIDAREMAYLSTMGGVMPLRELVTLAFSAKESLYKGAFGIVGRFFDFHAARISSFDAERASIELTIEEDLHPLFPRGRRCTVSYERLDVSTYLTVFEAHQLWDRRQQSFGTARLLETGIPCGVVSVAEH
jgi:4'-phosphopantetheinyl transferase EntD